MAVQTTDIDYIRLGFDEKGAIQVIREMRKFVHTGWLILWHDDVAAREWIPPWRIFAQSIAMDVR